MPFVGFVVLEAKRVAPICSARLQPRTVPHPPHLSCESPVLTLYSIDILHADTKVILWSTLLSDL